MCVFVWLWFDGFWVWVGFYKEQLRKKKIEKKFFFLFFIVVWLFCIETETEVTTPEGLKMDTVAPQQNTHNDDDDSNKISVGDFWASCSRVEVCASAASQTETENSWTSLFRVRFFRPT